MKHINNLANYHPSTVLGPAFAMVLLTAMSPNIVVFMTLILVASLLVYDGLHRSGDLRKFAASMPGVDVWVQFRSGVVFMIAAMISMGAYIVYQFAWGTVFSGISSANSPVLIHPMMFLVLVMLFGSMFSAGQLYRKVMSDPRALHLIAQRKQERADYQREMRLLAASMDDVREDG